MRREAARILKWAAGLALGAAMVAASLPAGAQGSWKGMDPIETMNPRFERKSTLRVLRSNGDLDDTVNDQGSILGFGAAAASGNLESRTEPGTTESLEIMKKGELSASGAE